MNTYTFIDHKTNEVFTIDAMHQQDAINSAIAYTMNINVELYLIN